MVDCVEDANDVLISVNFPRLPFQTHLRPALTKDAPCGSKSGSLVMVGYVVLSWSRTVPINDEERLLGFKKII